MTISPKERFDYMVERDGEYLVGQVFATGTEGRKPEWRFSRNKSDGKRFGSIQDAREYSGRIGGGRIVRYDKLTGRVADVLALMKEGTERRWV